MPGQHSRPFIVRDMEKCPASYALTRRRTTATSDDDKLTESWLQEFLFSHPEVLPVDEIEPVFGPLIPICRELQTSAGPLDILFGSSSGLLTLVECKLWKNPEARRQVVGQILDYAKEFSRWSYEDLEGPAISSGSQRNLYQTVSSDNPELEERNFVDIVSRNMRRGRFLLLIVGDGIRESVEEISEFLQAHAHLNFSFALVEIATFSVPKEIGGGVLVTPRLLCRTVEIERAVVRLEGDGIVATGTPSTSAVGHGTKISEQVFYESLDAAPETVTALKNFLAKAQDLGLILDTGSKSLMLKSEDGRFNFATFRVDGTVRNHGIAKRTNDLGFPELGERYLEQLASLFSGGEVNRATDNRFQWTVRKDGRYLAVTECLEVQDQWLNLLRKTTQEIDDATR